MLPSGGVKRTNSLAILLALAGALGFSQTLEVSPAQMTLTASGTNPQDLSTPIFVRNAGTGGPQVFTFGISLTNPECANFGGLGFFATEIKTSHITNDGAPALIMHAYLGINPNNNVAIKPGFYRLGFRVTMGAQIQEMCLNFLASPAALSLSISKVGLQFSAQTNIGTTVTQFIPILATGSPSAFSATAVSESNFLNIVGASNGTITPGFSGGITVSVNKLASPGTYYGTVIIKPTSVTLAASAVTVVYKVTDAAPQPEIGVGGGILFGTPTATPALINVSLSPSLSPGVTSGYSVTTDAQFLSITNASGNLSGTAPSQIQIAAILSKAVKGFNRTSLIASLPGGIQRIIDFLLIQLPTGAVTAASAQPNQRSATANCIPTQIAVVSTSVAGGFSQTAGSPVVYQTRVIDDCANPVTDATVSLSFSNGDGSLIQVLDSAQTGTYTATWIPILGGATTITARATSSGTSFNASTKTSGTVLPAIGPLVAQHGTLNNLYLQLGAAVAPGTVASVFGSGLATAAVSPGVLPLPTSFQGTSVTVGGIPAPLFYVSPGQVNIQIPVELASNATYPVIVTNGKAFSVPDSITISDVAPGVAAFGDGGLIAQHADYQLVDTAHPAATGEAIIAYLVGMGATNPTVGTGQLAPGVEPLARVRVAAVITVDGKTAEILFAGLTPGGIGLYQVVFVIPKDITTAGSKKVTIAQAGVNANATTIPIVLAK